MNGDFDFVTTPLAPGLSVIEASAGTGKTHALSHLVPRLLLDGTAANLGQILLVTFTNDAARELAERVRRVLAKLAAPPPAEEAATDNGLHRLREKFGGDRVREVAGRALLDLDLLGVSTIHSFCQRTLQTEGPLCGLPVVPELIPDASEIAKDVLADLWEREVAGDPLVAAVAVHGAWSQQADLAFLRSNLALTGAEFVPAARPFADVLNELRGAPARFTREACEDVRVLLEECDQWNAAAPDAAKRAECLAVLAGATALDARFLEAVGQLAGSPSWIKATSKERKRIKACLEECAAVQSASDVRATLGESGWQFRIHCLEEIRRAVADSLAADRRITYDGLIETLRQALRGPKAAELAARLRARYTVALVDESQDTDERQFEIFRNVFVGFVGEEPAPDRRLVLIGDPKQAIYAFRDADVNTYLGAKTLAGGNIFPLTRTFRSPQPLVAATNALFARPGSLLKEGLGFHPATSGLEGDVRLVVGGGASPARMECWIVPDADGPDYSNNEKRHALIAAAVASEIARLLTGGAALVRTKSDGTSTTQPVKPSHFAVLVSDRFHAAAVAEALRERAVPAIRAGGEDIMAAEEAAELLLVLRALHEPRRSRPRLAALATRFFGLDSAGLRAAREGGDEWMDRMTAWQAVWLREGIAAALAAIDGDCKVTPRLARLERGERRVTNLRQLTDLLEAAWLETGRQPGHLVKWLVGEIARVGANRPPEDRQLQLESDAEAVQIVTMHSAKGLQYPLVFCPFLWASKAPSGCRKLARAGLPPEVIDTGRADSERMAALARAEMEDRLRLAYVAVTRAQVKVWLVGGEVCGTKTPASALDWLLRVEETADFSEWSARASAAGRGTRHAAGLRALAAAGGAEELIAWGPPPAPDDRPWRGAGETDGRPLGALAAPEIPRPWGLTSFSALTREKNPHGAAEHVVADRVATKTFADAPGGAMVGTAVHEWIERWDFSPPDRAALAAHFAGFPVGESPEVFTDRVAGMLDALREAVLPGMDCRIREACRSAAASEWHFQLPIGGSLGAAALADVFAAHGETDYAARLAALPAEQLLGYLHGFIDRIAFHDGAWGVIDWKTNQLGPSAYGLASLRECAERSHYLLQAHLYLVALRRFLGPGAKIAGVWLVFLRGVSADSADGILHVRPPEPLMAGLDALFARPTHA